MVRLPLVKLTIYTDGASRGNPGLASYGFAIFNEDGSVFFEEGKAIGIATNNVAEYTAVLESLERVTKDLSHELPIEIFYRADSKLVVEQLSGRYKIKNEVLKGIIHKIKALEVQVGKVTYTHIPREQNKIADKLANIALDNL